MPVFARVPETPASLSGKNYKLLAPIFSQIIETDINPCLSRVFGNILLLNCGTVNTSLSTVNEDMHCPTKHLRILEPQNSSVHELYGIQKH